MSQDIDLYWSFRSPYSYLALKSINDMATRRDVSFHLRIVHPLAIRAPEFFDSRGPSWLGYVMRDIVRIAQMTGQVIALPNPDPIVQNMMTAEIAADQPHIYRLARLGIVASEAGIGLPFVTAMSEMIWSGQNWAEGTALSDHLAKVHIDLNMIERSVQGQEARLDEQLAENDRALRKAGHWGVPTCVVNGEPFFGMDRLNVLDWRLDQMGIE